MAEELFTLDGAPVDLDTSEAAFAAAMAAPPADRPTVPAPGRRPAEPAPDAVNAPFGFMWEGGAWRPKRAPGRPARPADKARVTDAPAPPSSPASATGGGGGKDIKPLRDFRGVIADTIQAGWFMLASTPIPEQVFGFKLGKLRTRIRVQAALLESNVDSLVNGLNMVANHNRFLERQLTRMAKGEGGLWVIPATMMLAPFVTQTGQLWAGELSDTVSLDAIAAKTEVDAMAYLKGLAEAMMPEHPQPSE